MAIKDGIKTLLLAQSSITTLCPAQTVQKNSFGAIFVDAIKQGIVPPYIKISRTGFDPMECLDGTAGMGSTDIEIECLAYEEPDAAALAKAVSDYFKDYYGAAGASDTIDCVNWTGVSDDVIPEGNGGDIFRYAVKLQFTVMHH